MSLRDLMLKDLARGLAMVRDGHEIVPTWHIIAPEGDFLILTRFDPDKPQQRDRMLTLVPLFMAWKMALAFVLTAETWLGPAALRVFSLSYASSVSVSMHADEYIAAKARECIARAATSPRP